MGDLIGEPGAEEPASEHTTSPRSHMESLGLGDAQGPASPPGPGSFAHDATVEQLAAVASVMGRDRRATEFDIVIQAAMEPLRDGPKTEGCLVDHLQRVWPGAGINAARLASALGAARQAGLLLRASRKGEVQWSLTPEAAAEVSHARDWAADIVDTTARQIRDQLSESGRDITEADSRLWADRLKHVLLVAVRGSMAAYEGDVIGDGDTLLALRHYDIASLRRAVYEESPTSPDAELLFGLASNAINPVTSFANDLITAITVGYMLYAFIGRLDRLRDRALIGSLKGEYAILDTTVLPLLLGAPEQAESLNRAISAALEEGMTVIVPEHYLTELQEKIGAIGREERPVIQIVERGSADPGDVAAIIDNEFMSLWLQGMAAGVYTRFAGFRKAASRLGGTLRALGVQVGPHGNKAEDNPRRFIAPLAAELAKRGRTRGQAALRRDAETMAMVYRFRRTAAQSSFWPNAWIITIDSCMGPAYRSLYPHDRFPLTLTPASWLSILCNCSSPGGITDLAKAASRLLAEDAFMNLAARFSPKAAAEIARALGPQAGGSRLELHIAQLSLDQILERQPDFNQDNNALGAQIAAEVIRKRGERQSSGFELARAREDADKKRAEERYRSDLAKAIAAREAAEGALRNARAEASSSEGAAADARVLGHRLAVLAAMIVAMAACAAGLAYFHAWPGLGFTIVAMIVVVYQGRRWTSDVHESWRDLILGSVVGVIGVGGSFFDWPWK